MKNNQNQPKKVNVEALLAKKNQISNAAIQAAITKMEEAKAKAQEEQVIVHLAEIQSNTERAVSNLRHHRKLEKASKNYLEEIAMAEQAFYTNADFTSYEAARNVALKEYNRAVNS